MTRTIRRLSHEIVERNIALDDLVLLGIKHNGTPLASMIQKNIMHIEGIKVPMHELDISGYRDDVVIDDYDQLNLDLSEKIVVVIDDVLFTGRTARASMDACIDLGRPKKIQLCILVDRGHRELPIRADFVGKNIPTNINEKIVVNFTDDKGVFIKQLKEK
ncbi:MAG: bifunctional pyr operon transcriptional regulator/uracil phosphoribosyltransferase PyrR [Candidatus Izimaplasma sp.]|nr:bifunctional pyr operon transcriptional regulator/uracil phosphoribosyltransferase PyrR [Candidatus Izimaplasma bacterium]